MQRLEQKVEDLAAQLDTLTKQPQLPSSSLEAASSASYTPSSQPYDVSGSGPSSNPGPQASNSLEALGAAGAGPGPAQLVVNGTKRRYDKFDHIAFGLDDLDELLHIFRNDFFPEFPFILLSSEDTSESLRHKNPFLLWSIVAATSYKDFRLQRRLGREIQRQIATRIIMDNEKSLDLLQGLLVHLAWHHYFLRPESPQILLFLQLCINLVNGLGLGRDHSARTTSKVDRAPNLRPGTEPVRGMHSLCELRAFLGTYYLCSR